MRLRRIVIIVLVSALVTGLSVFWLLSVMVAPGQVVVAARDIAARSLLTSESLKVIKVARGAIHENAAGSVDELVGRAVMYPLLAGEQVMRAKLVDGVMAGRISASLAEGERAIMIPVPPERAVGGTIGPFDRVDIVFVANQAKAGYQLTRTILSGVEVLAVRADKTSGLGGSAQSSEGVIVRVSGQGAEEIASALANGDVFLTLVGGGAAAAPADANPN